MSNKLPPLPVGVAPGSGYWNDWYEKLRTLINSIVAGLSHSTLSNLSSDDHPQYYNTSRGDARWSLLGHTHSIDDITMTQLALEYDVVSSTLSYLGEANPGTATSAASWRIKKLVFDASGDITVTYADGNSSFDNVWDNRASLSYS